MTTQEQRAEWRALAQAATPGEWKPRISEETTDHEVIMFDVEIDYTVTVAMCTSMLRYMDNEPNARFIAAARTAVPALLADVDALQAETERNAATQRAEDAEAKLALVDEYGQSQWNSGVSGGEFEAGPYETFAEWLAQREELL